MTRVPTESRLHALDHLRATMMLLGVVIHSAVSYMVYEPDLVWPYRDLATSSIFDVLVGLIHSFRMPIFFLMSGFFAALIYDKRGAKSFAGNRIKRILLPFLVGWPLIFPIIFLGFSAAIFQLGKEAYDNFINTPLDWLITLWHFWFIYYLLMFYALTLLFKEFPQPVKWKQFSESFIRFGVGKLQGLFLLGLVSALTFFPMKSGALDSDIRWAPNLGIFLAYGFIYWCGWKLYGQRDLLARTNRYTYHYLFLAILILPIASYFLVQVVKSPELSRPFPHLWAALSNGLLMWALIFGITGLFLRIFNTYNSKARYLTDSAYWVYLIHLPIAIWTTSQLTHLDLSAGIKFTITFGVTISISLLSYHLFVRRTFIGFWLNGKRA